MDNTTVEKNRKVIEELGREYSIVVRKEYHSAISAAIASVVYGIETDDLTLSGGVGSAFLAGARIGQALSTEGLSLFED